MSYQISSELFQVGNTVRSGFPFPSPGTLQLTPGDAGWLNSQEAQGRIELPTFGFPAGDLNH